MKIESVTIGNFEVGVFQISINRPVFRKEPTEEMNFFWVLVIQKEPHFYVDLVEEERFGILKHLQTFSRKLTEEDLIEYNSHVSSVFHKIGMPGYLLSRHSIVTLFDSCQTLSKKIKKSK